LPPSENDPRYEHRKHVLDLCLPCESLRNQRRRCILEINLTGDWDSPVLEHYCGSFLTFNKRAWARQTAWALFPCRIEEFQRHRWLNKTTCVLDVTLLCACHRIFENAIPMWLRAMGTKPPKKRHDPGERSLRDPWDPASESDDEPGDLQMDRPRGPGLDGDWAKFNSAQRGDTWTFAASEPLGDLLVLGKCLAPQQHLMASMLKRTSAKWKLEQYVRSVQSGAVLLTPLLDIVSHRLTEIFVTEVVSLLLDETQ
jgi:hypothetical protein